MFASLRRRASTTMRASRLAALKEPLGRTRFVPWLLKRSPTAAHLLENAYRHVLTGVLRPEAKRDAADFEARLATFTAQVGDTAIAESEETPVFILAAGWRSGSTLLQRVLMSGTGLMVWGEPFARSGITTTLADQIRAFTSEWPPANYFVDGFDDQLAKRWVANSYPTADRLLAAHRCFFTELLAEPARALGYAGWGFKEVRLGGSHARYLKLLFPRAKFVILVRDPYASYTSFRHYIKSDFIVWPNQPIFSPTEYGRMWADIAGSLAASCDDVGGLLMRYEDYIKDGGASHQRLCEYLGMSLPSPAALELIPAAGQSGDSESRRPEHRLFWWERAAMRRQLGQVARRFGYD